MHGVLCARRGSTERDGIDAASDTPVSAPAEVFAIAVVAVVGVTAAMAPTRMPRLAMPDVSKPILIAGSLLAIEIEQALRQKR
jgi:hypothetical protein